MVGDEQVGVELDRLVDRGGDGVDGEEDALDRGTGIARDEPRGIPRLGALERPQPIDRRQDLGENGWHPPSLSPQRTTRPEGRGGPCRARTDDIHGVNVALYQLS